MVKTLDFKILRLLAFVALMFCAGVFTPQAALAKGKSTRQERRAIIAGNKLYKEGKFAESVLEYKNALQENPESAVARFNLGLGRISMAAKGAENDSVKAKLMQEGAADLTEVAGLAARNPSLSSKANYNLGNMSFDKQDYAGAINFYKQALRLNPNFPEARRNLRIAQLRQQKNQKDKNQDKNQNKNQDKKDQDKKDQDKQDKDEQEQQDKQQQPEQQDKQRPEQNPAENEISRQAASQILNAVENNEASVRARKATNKGEKAAGEASALKKW